MNQRSTVNRAKLLNDPFAGVSEALLIKRVLEAIAAVDELIPFSTSEDLKPAQIVTLLTYCYAKGIYSSEEIESRLREKSIAYICAGLKPDWHQLRRFRRENVFLLIEALAQLLRLMEFQTSVVGDARDEARRRLHLAIQTDSMAMDQ